MTDKITEMLEGITPFPWEAIEGVDRDYMVISRNGIFDGCLADVVWEVDAAFIAAAPQLVQKLHEQCEAMAEALAAIMLFIPKSAASEGGANSYSANVRAADKVRHAYAQYQQFKESL